MQYGARFYFDDHNEPAELLISGPGGGGSSFATGIGQSQGGLLVTMEENVLRMKQEERNQALI